MTLRPHMTKVRAKNTSPELRLRRLILSMGYKGYRIHYTKLPGKPDIVFTRTRKIMFMHGCFWHGHDCKSGKNTPNTNTDYWMPKLQRNKDRDKKRIGQLKMNGWCVLVIWECQLSKPEKLRARLYKFLN